ncbi:hypothetical protein [Leptolyngbya iicbica]|uniref:Uncharacterized protein n=2 Tax=Cyanophyceae TaxID=3028117 RepID=A0A4Q7E9X0_9CYAN|nr:hypothetical protein [Leptolyngbya sp. LK]RZM77795.1 hypothetical protein DYY88_14565 [Leptolyngbya sp. LK]
MLLDPEHHPPGPIPHIEFVEFGLSMMVESIDHYASNTGSGSAAKTLTLSLKLLSPYADRLQQAAELADISNTKMAQRLVVHGLEHPDQEALLQNIDSLTAEIIDLRHEYQKLQVEIEGLRVATYLTTELLLVLIGDLSPEEAHQVMQEVLAEGDGE